MIRFLALSWDASHAALVEPMRRQIGQDVRPWRCLCDEQGFALWAIDLHPKAFRRLADGTGGGWLLGRAFRRGMPTAQALTTGQLPSDVCAGSFAELASFVSDWWGSYVLFGRHADRRFVFRDPSGALPCWHIDLAGVQCWFADVGDLRRLFNPHFSVSEAGLAAHVGLPKLGKTVSCLEQVEPLLPAARALVTGKPSAEPAFAWSPQSFSEDMVLDPASATELVRYAVEEVLCAYAQHFKAPLISVGGLDSSILWSTARSLELDNIRGFSLYSRSGRGDERDYVTTLPGQDRLDLLPMDGEKIDPAKVFAPTATVDPPGFADLVELSWDKAALSGPETFDLLVYGVGGDNVFLQGAGILGALDYATARRSIAGIWKAASDSARYSKRWLPGVLAAALGQRFRKNAAQADLLLALMSAPANPLIALPGPNRPDPIEALHPLLRESLAQPPGKALQTLTSCFCASEYFDPWEGEGQSERFEFYLSQPVVEACLRIPSWILALDGVERGLARLAFADVLPDKVIRRMTKGTPEDVYAEFLQRHRSAIRDHLCSGVLAAKGIVSADHLASALDDEPEAGIALRAHPIIQLVSLESWYRHWTT